MATGVVPVISPPSRDHTTSSAGGFAAWGWSGWLRLKTREIDARPAGAELPAVGQRIDLADLKERIRKLEAIAAGVDL